MNIIDGRIDGGMYRFVDGQMDKWMDVWTDRMADG